MTGTVDDVLKKYTLKALSGQLFCPAAFIHDDEEGIARTEQLIREHKIGGLTFFHSRVSAATNYEKKEVPSYTDSLEKLKNLIIHYQSLSEIPLLMSIDAEWGLAMRVENTQQYPYALTLGALPESSDHMIYEAAFQIGKDLKSIGIDYNLAPVADINSNPDNPVIGYRSFGASRALVTKKAAQFCRGLSDAGIANCLKHFPGHGDTAVDSHLGLPLIKKNKEALFREELYPFKALIAQGVDSVMIGHLAVPALSGEDTLPATLSKKIIKDLLRETLGFNGLVISDALNMHSVSKIYPEKGELELRAFEAGNDLLCFSEHVKEGIEKISFNASESHILESTRRILELKNKVGLFSEAERPAATLSETASQLNKRMAQKSIVALKNTATDANTIVLIGDTKRENGFVETLRSARNCNVINVEQEISTLQLSPETGVIIALFPPFIKPIEQFGISSENLNLINNLLHRQNTTLCIFGNPYVIREISGYENTVNTLLCGQDLREFQQTAAEYLLKKTSVTGALPFPL